MTVEQMTALRKKIDIKAVMPEEVAFARRFHRLCAEGLEHVPRRGPVVIVCNHLATPFWPWLMVEDTPIIAHALEDHMGRPARILGALGFYHPPEVARVCRRTVERLGFVPATFGNGIRLLEMGEAVLIHPEGDASGPPYRTKPFVWGFAKLALAAGVPIVPGALIGPHESRPPIVKNGRQIIVNMHRPLQADYKLMFLPPVDVRAHVAGPDDVEGLTRFCELVRGQVQAALDRESAHRPLVRLARELQARYGDPE
jgi:1-acyl-sn-glycerol-3-phosphate acyltransferase